MEREQATKFMYDLLRALLAKKGSDLFITGGLPAGDEDRRQDDAGVAAGPRRRSTRASWRARS